MEIREFIEARLAEDQWVAEGAIRNSPGVEWHGPALQSPFDSRVDEHIVRHDPARVLRDVESARQRIGLAEKLIAERGHPFWAYAGERLLKLEAAAWSDHPGYDEAWRP